MKLHEKIKAIRINENLTQTNFAEKIGIGQSAISYLEKGEKDPSVETLISICKTFNINANWLLLDIGNMKNEVYEDEIINRYMLLTEREKGRIEQLISEIEKHKSYIKTGNLY